MLGAASFVNCLDFTLAAVRLCFLSLDRRQVLCY